LHPPEPATCSRIWVSGVGDDANPCSRTAPCKTFAGAISKTAAAGEIDCLDPGGFGAITITKSITLNCSATLGSILVSGTNAVTITAATTDRSGTGVQATGGKIRLSNSDINFNTVNGLTGSPTSYGNNRIFGSTGTTMCGVQPGRTVIPGLHLAFA
jgi:hypothetical protein